MFVLQITSSQASCLGGERRYMQKFLSVISFRIDSVVFDLTLKYTLSALLSISGEKASDIAMYRTANNVKCKQQLKR